MQFTWEILTLKKNLVWNSIVLIVWSWSQDSNYQNSHAARPGIHHRDVPDRNNPRARTLPCPRWGSLRKIGRVSHHQPRTGRRAGLQSLEFKLHRQNVPGMIAIPAASFMRLEKFSLAPVHLGYAVSFGSSCLGFRIPATPKSSEDLSWLDFCREILH